MSEYISNMGQKENIDVTRLCILLGDRTVEAVLRSHGQGEAVNEEFALLLVTLGCITFQAVGNVAEIGLPVASISQLA